MPLAVHVVRKGHTGEQKSHWDNANKRHAYIILNSKGPIGLGAIGLCIYCMESLTYTQICTERPLIPQTLKFSWRFPLGGGILNTPPNCSLSWTKEISIKMLVMNISAWIFIWQSPLTKRISTVKLRSVFWFLFVIYKDFCAWVKSLFEEKGGTSEKPI